VVFQLFILNKLGLDFKVDDYSHWNVPCM